MNSKEMAVLEQAPTRATDSDVRRRFSVALLGLTIHATGTHIWRCELPSIAPPTLKSATGIDRPYRLTTPPALEFATVIDRRYRARASTSSRRRPREYLNHAQ